MKKNTKNFIIFLVCYIAYTAIYIARLNLSMATPGLVEDFILTQEQIGIIGSAFFVVYAIGRIVNGYIGDKTSPWIMIATGLLISGVSNLLIGLLPPFIGILLLWSSNAFAQSMLWSSLVRIVSEIYPQEKAKKMMSYMVTSVATGNILGIILNTVIINYWGLAFAFILPGTLLIILCIVVIMTLKSAECRVVDNRHISMFSLLKENKIQAVLTPAICHGIIKDNISLWMAVFFVEQYGIDLNSSAYFVLFIPVVGLIGRFIFPALYKLHKQQENKLVVHSFLLCVICSALLLFKTIPPIMAIVCLSLIYAAISVINTVFLSLFPLQFSATGNQASVSGIMDFFTYFGAGIGSLIFGYLINYFGYGAMFLCYAAVSLISILNYSWRGNFRETSH